MAIMTITEDNIEVFKASGTRNGYWVSASDMDRPWCVKVDGVMLTTKAGFPRRFCGVVEAKKAARKFIAGQVAA